MNILIFSGFSGFTQRLDNAAALLQASHDGAVDSLVFGEDNHRYLQTRAKARYRRITCVEHLLERASRAEPPTAARLAEVEARLGHSLTHIAYSERTFVQHTHALPMRRRLSQGELAAHVVAMHDALDALLDDIDAVFVYACASLSSELLYYLCRARGIRFITMNEQRLGYRWLITDNNQDRHPAVMARYRDPGFSATDAGRKRLDDYVAKLRRDEKNVVQTLYQRTALSRKRLTPANITRYIRNMLFQDSKRFYLSPTKAQHSLHLLRYKLREAYLRRTAGNDLPDRRFVYFPLSMIPEASTLIRGLRHYDQLGIIKALSLALPIDWVLLVREHPSSIGQTPIHFYREVQRIFNVRLVTPYNSPLACTERAEAVVTVTGTTGMESLALGKRTIVLGSTLYGEIDSAFRTDDPAAIGNILRTPWTDDDAARQAEDMARFASALEAAPGFDDPDNILWTAAAANPAENPVDGNLAAALRAHLQTNTGPAAR